MADLTSGTGHCDGFPESGTRKVPDKYDHDRVSIHEPIDLGVEVAKRLSQ